ncbi:MAG: phosphoadenosine phosphosulfate reductase [Pseudomonadota bacterium]
MIEEAAPRGEFPDFAELPRDVWPKAVRDYAFEVGDYIELDEDHAVIQVGDGDRLIVTFESAHEVRQSQEDAIPLGFKLAKKMNASVITVLAKRPTWYRSSAVYGFFDHLTDEGIFEAYDHVMFYGAGMGGYGAAAFSVASPGADVIAISPQATLDARMTDWDPRFTSMRRRSFTDRYGYAPDMIEGARHALVIYNPDDDVEAMHATLFARPGVTRFRCKHMGRDIEASLMDVGALTKAIELASQGKMSLRTFAKLYRARRNSAIYLKNLLVECQDKDRPKLITWLASTVLQHRRMPIMRRALAQANSRLEAADAAE